MSSDDEEPEVVESDAVEAESEPEPAAAREETVETRSIEARRKLREQMQADIDKFLKSGGQIEHVEPSVTEQESNPAGVTDSV